MGEFELIERFFRRPVTRAVLGVGFRPWDESLRDCVESLIAVAGVQPRRLPAGVSAPA